MAAPLALAFACAAPEASEEEQLGALQQEVIRDGSNGGTPGFTWLAPINVLPRTSGTFEARLSPLVVIEQVDAQGKSLKTLATYTGSVATSGELILRNLTQQYYVARFKSAGLNLNPTLRYRARVLPAAGQPALGFADIDLVNNLVEYLLVDRRNYVPLIKNNTLAIRFRIAKNAVDKDGDGVFDWLDNCPTTKNPPSSIPPDVGPVTAAVPSGCNPEETSCDPKEQPLNPIAPTQPDADGDGIGDACDCPAGQGGTPPSCVADLTETTTTCFCPSGEILLTCTDTCELGGSEQLEVCADLCGATTSTVGTSCTLVGDGQCDRNAPCPTGFQPGTPNPFCRDINECALDIDGCNPTQICVNLDGTFDCQQCPTGSQNNGSDRCTPL